MNTISMIDEFGRDLTLRKPKVVVIQTTSQKHKGKKWADICDEIEEEIERACLLQEQTQREQKQKQNEQDRKIFDSLAKERNMLLIKGLYDLEEGELLE